VEATCKRLLLQTGWQEKVPERTAAASPRVAAGQDVRKPDPMPEN